MPSGTATAASTIMAAMCPEDVFGDLPGSPAEQRGNVQRGYRQLARLVHPDSARPEDKPSAAAAFARLLQFREAAGKAIDAGTYGQRQPLSATHPVTIHSRRHVYRAGDPYAKGDIANLYHCTDGEGTSPALLKVARNAADNDLIQAEASALRHLLTPDQPAAKGFFPFLPRITDSFSFRDSSGPARQANVFDWLPGFHALEEVREAYPHGIDPKHMAWIWRRLLLVLGYTHTRGVIHGAVLPPHVLIHPDHDLLLTDWCYAIRGQTAHIPAISERYADWYPPEILARQPPSPATDIYLSARCMAYLMGENGNGQGIPPRITGFITSCLLKAPPRRPQDAWLLRKEFTKLIEQIWGPRTYLPFTMPSTQ